MITAFHDIRTRRQCMEAANLHDVVFTRIKQRPMAAITFRYVLLEWVPTMFNGEGGIALRDMYEWAKVPFCPMDFTDDPRFNAFCAAWHDAIRVVMEAHEDRLDTSPGDSLWLADLCFPEVADLKSPVTVTDYYQSFLTPSRMGRYLDR